MGQSSKEYHKMVWKQAKEETESYFRSDWRSWIGSIVSGIAAAGLSSWATNYLGDVSMLSPLTTAIIIGASTLFGLAIFIVGLWGWNGLWNLPAKLYRKKEIEASKFTWRNVTIKNSKPKSLNIDMAYLVISNEKDFDIENVSVQITIMKKGKFIFEPHMFPQNFCWVDENEARRVWTPQKLLKGGKAKRIIMIAGWLMENKGVHLMSENKTDSAKESSALIELEMNTVYLLVLEWFGEIDGRKMDSHTTFYNLSYTENEISLEEIFPNPLSV